MKAVLPEMLKGGLANTLILAAASVVLGTVLGMIVAVMGLSRRRWLRWPATVEHFGAASLEVSGIELAFGNNKVLRGVDLVVPAGKTACVIGPSGSGKSTLLRATNRLLEPDAVDIRLGGESVLKSNPDELRRRIGMVFQHFNLFPHKTVLENITLPLRKIKKLSTDGAAEAARVQLELVGLREKESARPGNLSGGQRGTPHDPPPLRPSDPPTPRPPDPQGSGDL